MCIVIAPTVSPANVTRDHIVRLEDLPNIGKAGAADLRLIGIDRPAQLPGQQPWQMYRTLCEVTGQRHDPCVIDVFMSVVNFMEGADPLPWWAYTSERKARMLDGSFA